MRAVVQRVKSANVAVDGEQIAAIGPGLMVLVGIEDEDTQADIDYIVRKCVGLRVFDDENGQMNRSVEETGGEILVVSQFTLLGDVRKGRRPSYARAMSPEKARPFFAKVLESFRGAYAHVQNGQFQAEMLVSLANDGPVTILLDSKKNF